MDYNVEDALKLTTADYSDVSDFSDHDSDTDVKNLKQGGIVQDQENDSTDKGEDEKIEVECVKIYLSLEENGCSNIQ